MRYIITKDGTETKAFCRKTRISIHQEIGKKSEEIMEVFLFSYKNYME